MFKQRYGIVTAMAAMVLLSLCACDDNPLENPYNMVTVNMHDEDNGRTLMGLTDIYITRDHNFYSPSEYYICDFGAVLDLGHVEEQKPDLSTVTNVAAVQPDEGYLAFRRDQSMRFSSGKVAIASTASYYRMWVDEWIKKDKLAIGAVVNFATYLPSSDGLPEWGTVAATGAPGETIVAEIPERDCEVMPADESWQVTTTSGKHSTTATIAIPSDATVGQYPLYVRHDNTYVTLRITVAQ